MKVSWKINVLGQTARINVLLKIVGFIVVALTLEMNLIIIHRKWWKKTIKDWEFYFLKLCHCGKFHVIICSILILILIVLL